MRTLGRLLMFAALGGAGYLLFRQLQQQGVSLALPSWLPQLPSSSSSSDAGAPAVTSTSSSLPRGVRNNNPGNIRGGNFQGITGKDADGFDVFDSSVSGLRALFLNLKNYGAAGFNTVRKIVNRWAPPAENLTDVYAQNVSLQTGYALDQALDLNDRDVARAIGLAIIRQENGQQPYGVLELETALTGAGYA